MCTRLVVCRIFTGDVLSHCVTYRWAAAVTVVAAMLLHVKY
jgi:hypothetical protein